MKVYIAAPLFNEGERAFNEKIDAIIRECGHETFLPQREGGCVADLLETDADIAANLYQIACVPHLTGEYADQSVNARSLRELIALVPDQNSHLTGENAVRSREQLLVLEGLRKDQLKKLRQCGAFHAYEESKGKYLALFYKK